MLKVRLGAYGVTKGKQLQNEHNAKLEATAKNAIDGSCLD